MSAGCRRAVAATGRIPRRLSKFPVFPISPPPALMSHRNAPIPCSPMVIRSLPFLFFRIAMLSL
jgi:hypothetical protein